MGDEEAFLAAIRDAGDDDLSRLVYADWLDERDDARAGYVRLAVDAAARIRQRRPWIRVLAKLTKVADGLDLGWREVTERRGDVVLRTFGPEYKIRTIIAIRQALGLGLAEAKALTESAPVTVRHAVLLEDAGRLRRNLESGFRYHHFTGVAERLPKGQHCCVVSIQAVRPPAEG